MKVNLEKAGEEFISKFRNLHPELDLQLIEVRPFWEGEEAIALYVQYPQEEEKNVLARYYAAQISNEMEEQYDTTVVPLSAFEQEEPKAS